MNNAVVAIDRAKARQAAAPVTGRPSKLTVSTSFANTTSAKESPRGHLLAC
jgi:hypothetical protein